MPSYTFTGHLPGGLGQDETELFCTYYAAHLRATPGVSSWFIQAERQGDNSQHVHVVVDIPIREPYLLRALLAQFGDRLSELYTQAEERYYSSAITSHRQRNGAHKPIQFGDYIAKYLLTKAKWEPGKDGYIFALHNNGPVGGLMTQESRDALCLTIIKSQPETPIGKCATSLSGSAQDFMTYVTLCVEHGVGDTEKCEKELPILFWNMVARGNMHHLEHILGLAKQTMIEQKTLSDYLATGQPPAAPPLNCISKIFADNGYDVGYVCALLYKWGNKETGKRNTILLRGPPNTGKTLVTSAIAKASPFYGMVNKNNENFPFNDCTSAMVIWWEEGDMTSKHVQDAKCLMGGTEVKIDKKSRGQKPVPHTPLMMTTNGEPWVVTGGNTCTREHEGALRSRWIRFEFHKLWHEPCYPTDEQTKAALTQIWSYGKAHAHRLKTRDITESPLTAKHHLLTWSLLPPPQLDKGTQECPHKDPDAAGPSQATNT